MRSARLKPMHTGRDPIQARLLDVVEARLLELVGTLELGWGRLIDNESLRARGERDRHLSRAWLAGGSIGAAPMARRQGH